MIWRWLLHDDSLGHIPNWNPVVAERHATATRHMLTGWAGNVRVVGHRPTERILAEREARLAQMRDRDRPRLRVVR